MAAAEAANKQAGALKNQWTTTAQTLAGGKDRRRRPDNYDKAVALAKHAEALAKASIDSGQGASKKPGRRLSSADAGPGERAREPQGPVRLLAVTAERRVYSADRARPTTSLYDIGRFGNARVLHLTDTHAQLLPVWFREPSVNLGIGAMRGQAAASWSGAPFSSTSASSRAVARAHAFTFLDYEEAAHRYGRMGGFAHLKTLIDRLRDEAGAEPYAAARRRRPVAGQRPRRRYAGRGHGRGCQSARRGGDDRPLGSSPMARRRCGAISSNSKASSWRRTSS